MTVQPTFSTLSGLKFYLIYLTIITTKSVFLIKSKFSNISRVLRNFLIELGYNLKNAL